MMEHTRAEETRDDDAVPVPGEAGASAGPGGYEGPGGWGTAALALLGGLFLVSAALTVHSVMTTFGG